MACRRCHNPDSGTDLCDSCEALFEHEQNLDDDIEQPWAEGYSCWFADTFPDVGSRDWAGPCEGRLVKCHLIKRQVLVREGLAEFVSDPRSWVYGCSGLTGLGGHHAQYKPDGPRRIPREMLPAGFVRLCEDLSLGWYLDRTFGPEELAA